MARKTQIVALVEPTTRTQLDMTRIFTKSSRARVLEDLILPALERLAAEARENGDMKRLEKLAGKAGVSVAQYVGAYASAYRGTPYGAGLEELEASDLLVREHLKHAKDE